MWSVALLLVTLLAAALVIWFLPVRVTLQLRQHNSQATFRTEVQVAWWKAGREVNRAAAAERAPQADGGAGLHRRAGKGSRPPWKPLLATVEAPMRYLLRRIRCRSLDLAVVVGGGDAMTSAILTGVVHGVVGVALGVLSRWVRLPRSGLRTQVMPAFQQLVWRVRMDCILTFRLGDAIVAGIWWLYRVRREPLLAAWLKQQRRSKGVEGSVRASDSGLDEDGHGKHQEHGGRQHGHR